ncbi:MAG: hypothetical protein K8R35_11370 [Bacteroidales bacterium]|nr:hypothetical protein [Bacteroidales bacterium]
MKKIRILILPFAILNTSLTFAQFPQLIVNNAIFGTSESQIKSEKGIKYKNDRTDKYLSFVKSSKSIHQIGPGADTLLITSDTSIYETIKLVGAGVLIVDNVLLQLYGHLDQYDELPPGRFISLIQPAPGLYCLLALNNHRRCCG